MKHKRVILFGELLMRLDTPQHERFVQAKNLEVRYTGGEANAGVVLAGFGVDCELVAAVPDNEIGQACLNHLRRFGLGIKYVRRCGPRLGVLFVETGAAQRPSKVLYDRAGSSFAQLKPGDIPWSEILRDAAWLHFSGTAPALSADLAELVIEGCQAAKSTKCTVSCDLNYRSTLWSIVDARKTMTRIAPHVDVLIANAEHAQQLLGTPPATLGSAASVFDVGAYRELIAWLRQKYSFSHVALTIRQDSNAAETTFAGLLDDGRESMISRVHNTLVVDRIGAGDAFSGGLIYGLTNNWPSAKTVEFAAALAAWKNTIPGDFCHVSLPEALAIAEHGGDGRIIR